jgi:hypothetical protein
MRRAAQCVGRSSVAPLIPSTATTCRRFAPRTRVQFECGTELPARQILTGRGHWSSHDSW